MSCKLLYEPDARLMVDNVEAAHPIFVMEGDMLSSNYGDIRDEYLTTVSKPLTLTEFVFATRKYLTVLCDGHMSVGFGCYLDNGLKISEFVNINWVYNDGKLLLTDHNGQPAGMEVTAIGGVPVGELMKQINAYFYAENEVTRHKFYELHLRGRDALSFFGAHIGGTCIEIALCEANGSTSTIEADFTTGSIFDMLQINNRHDYIIRHQMMDDVMYIDLRQFTLDKSVDETAAAIEKAVKDGGKKFIVDLRDNGGGNSRVGEQLLKAMGITLPSYGCYIRFSKLVDMGQDGEKEDEYFAPNVETVQNPNNVSVYVLTNANTYSSATMFGVWVQDGSLGKIIGEPSSNAPSCFGDMIGFVLPLSGIRAQVSYKHFLRPNPKADQNTLCPDVVVNADNALKKALEMFTAMTPRERFLSVINGKTPFGRLPMVEWAAWWGDTITEWEKQGLPANMSFDESLDYFGLDKLHVLWCGPSLPPAPEHGGPAVSTAEDYEAIRGSMFTDECIEWRLKEARQLKARHDAGEIIVRIWLDGFFFFPRRLFGIEPHLFAFYDQPELMLRMNEDLCDFNIRLLDALFTVLTPDFIGFAEDMSYNLGPMLSYEQYKTFILPFYLRLMKHIRGVKVLLDSDGDVTSMIPWMIEAGIHGVYPLERQAGVDIVKIREKFPEFILLGGYDKMVMPKDEAAMRAEFERILPVMKSGYFIPSVDHQTPPGVSLENYRIYMRLFKEYCEKAVQ